MIARSGKHLFPLREFRLKLVEVGEDAGMARTLQAAALPRIEARRLPAGTALAALGIVYGDIGTSALYGFKQAADAAGTLSPETIMGIVSVIVWSLIVIVSFKYAILIMRADNRGEGGIVALLALLDVRHAPWVTVTVYAIFAEKAPVWGAVRIRPQTLMRRRQGTPADRRAIGAPSGSSPRCPVARGCRRSVVDRNELGALGVGATVEIRGARPPEC
jgi:hypothetical protein